MTYGQRDVVVAVDPFGATPRRPYLVISNDSRPFQGEDYLVAGITTTPRDEAVPLTGEYDAGRLERESYVSPWTVLTVRDRQISKRIAVVSERILADVADALARYVAPG